MEKLLSISPHMSTGGAPQVLVKRLELIKDDLDVYVVEFNNYSNDFIIQKNRIKKILKPGHYFTLGDNKNELLDIIQRINPNYIHFEEIPELFNISYELASKIYIKNRSYKIFETTHSSDFNVDDKIFFPDKFLFVSQYNSFKFNKFGIPTEVIEYPVEKTPRDPQKKLNLMKKLNLDPNFKHIVNIGLFTPRKNQAYAFEIARKMIDYPVKFHFIGNQADNFKDYWQPLLKNKPNNCIIWGERDDIDDFLDASDLFLFTSMGFRWNKELNPLVIKEALEHQIPQFLFPLDVYNRKYDIEDTIHYLNGDSTIDASLLKNFLFEKRNLHWKEDRKYKIRAVHLLLEEDDRGSESIKNLEKLRDYGIDYVQHINKRYTDTPPKEFCARPWNVGGIAAYSLRGPHYGNYQSFKKAILTEFTDDIDFLMVFESDCKLNVPIEEFVEKVYASCDPINERGIYYMSFGDNRNLRTGEIVSDNHGDINDWMYMTNKIIGIQSIMFPKFARDFIFRSYETTPWDVTDLLYIEMFKYKGKAIAPRLTNQIEGLSTIQGEDIKHFNLKNLNTFLRDKNDKDIVVEFNKNDNRFNICLSDFFQNEINDINIVVGVEDNENIYNTKTTLSPWASIWVMLYGQENYNNFYFKFYYNDDYLFTKHIFVNNIKNEPKIDEIEKKINEIQREKSAEKVINDIKELQYEEVKIRNVNDFRAEWNEVESKIYLYYSGKDDNIPLKIKLINIKTGDSVFEQEKMVFAKQFNNWILPVRNEFGYIIKFFEPNDHFLFSKDIRFKPNDVDIIEDIEKIDIDSVEVVKKQIEEKGDIYLVLTYPDTKVKEETTIKCINSLKLSGKKIILASHYPVSKEIQDMVDYYLYDSYNPLIEHSLYNFYWSEISEGKVEINLNRLQKKNNLNQSLTVYNNIKNAIGFAHKIGYKNLISVSYDFIFTEDNLNRIDYLCEKMEFQNKKGYYMKYKEGDMNLLKSVFFITNIEFFDNLFENLRNPEKYNEDCQRLGSHNFLEDYFSKKLLPHSDSLLINETDEVQLFNNPNINLFSGVEYLAILPVKNSYDEFVVWFNSSNTLDNRRIEFIYNNNGAIQTYTHFVKDRTYYMKRIILRRDNDNYIIDVNFIDSISNEVIDKQTFNINLSNIDDIRENGLFTHRK